MSEWITLEGVPPYDGRYELAIGDGLTSREWGWIKRLAGYLPMQVDMDALGDPEFVCVLATIALRRAGRIEIPDVPRAFERLIDAPPEAVFKIEADDDEAEDDASPPAASSNASERTFGRESKTSSESSEPTPLRIGTPGLGYSELDRETSAS